jgi:glycosyltransferase involved in cell wall biosynthesis
MNDPIKVLTILENPGLGGINSVMIRIALGMKSLNNVEFTSAVLAARPEGWLYDKAKVEGVIIETIKCGSPLDLGNLPRIKKFINQRNVDIIHTHGWRANFYLRCLLDTHQIPNIPQVISKRGLPVMSSTRNYLYRILDQRPTRLADRVIPVDHGTEKGLLDWNVPAEKMKVIPNPAPPIALKATNNNADIRKELGIAQDATIILYFGRVEKEKGLFELFSAHQSLIANHRNIVTLLLGSGSCSSTLSAMVEQNQFQSSFILIGPQLDVFPYLSASDIVVLPSYSEGLPNSLLEAMAYAKPIIATNVGGIPELITHQVNGLLIPSKDAAALDQAITFLLDHPDLAATYAHNNQVKAKDFTPESIAKRYVECYQEVLQKNSQRSTEPQSTNSRGRLFH